MVLSENSLSMSWEITMINNLIQFLIWRNDYKAIVPLNGLQKDTILILKLNPLLY